MKKIKNVSLGDKVFAKVKGYPAWPARVEEDLGRKYKVYFYGTGETGIVKPEDLFSYVEHKAQYMKHLKRKDYSEAIEEIEAAIAEDDDNVDDEDDDDDIIEIPEESEPEEITLSDIEREEEAKRGLKRKLSVDSASGGPEAKKKAAPARLQLTENRRISQSTSVGLKTKPHSEEQSKVALEPLKTLEMKEEKEKAQRGDEEEEEIEKINNNKETASQVKHEETSEEDDLELIEAVKRSTKFKIVTPQELRDIIEEFELCVKDAEKGNEKPEDDTLPQNEILLARLAESKYIGIKLNRDRPDDPFDTEVERLRWKESDSRTALQIKEKVETGILEPTEKPELFETDLELTAEQQEDAIKDRIIERKRTKLRFLKIEATLVELDATIKTNLALDKADPKEALKDLDVMLDLNIEPLMLKKHSHVMEMVKRLRRYIGNIKEWKLEGEELEEFKNDAEQIRTKADIVYNKFKTLYTIPDDKTFWEVFTDECDSFKALTKNMSENQIFILCAEPGTKQASWDETDEQEELRIVANRNGKKVQDKEDESLAETTVGKFNDTHMDSHE